MTAPSASSQPDPGLASPDASVAGSPAAGAGAGAGEGRAVAGRTGEPVVRVPIGWLLDVGGAAVRARALAELGGTVLGEGIRGEAEQIALGHRPAVWLALRQGRNGSWSEAMLALPAPDDPTFAGVGTVPAVRRLAEYGWPLESPSFAAARRPLFRLLAQDEDPACLYELRALAGDPARARHERARLRDAAGAALARIGGEADPRLRGIAARMLVRAAAWLRSREADAGAVATEFAAPPSRDALAMLAFMPVFRSEHGQEVNFLLAALAATPPETGRGRRVPGVRIGGTLVEHPELVVADPIPERIEPGAATLPGLLTWLEILARLGALRRHDRWRQVLDRLLDARDRDGRFLRTAAPGGSDPFVWPMYPLGDVTSSAERAAEATFRLALIARLAGRPLELA